MSTYIYYSLKYKNVDRQRCCIEKTRW